MKKLIFIFSLFIFIDICFANCTIEIIVRTPLECYNGIYSYVTIKGPNYSNSGYTGQDGIIYFYNVPNDPNYTVTAVCPAYSEIVEYYDYPCSQGGPFNLCYYPFGGKPSSTKLFQNYPNPFNPTTKIKYAINTSDNVKLIVYDILGREVATLVNEFKEVGVYDIEFNASNLASGIYFYKMTTSNFTEIKKMFVIK